MRRLVTFIRATDGEQVHINPERVDYVVGGEDDLTTMLYMGTSCITVQSEPDVTLEKLSTGFIAS